MTAVLRRVFLRVLREHCSICVRLEEPDRSTPFVSEIWSAFHIVALTVIANGIVALNGYAVFCSANR